MMIQEVIAQTKFIKSGSSAFKLAVKAVLAMLTQFMME